MNCEHAKNELLLRQSGELPGSRQLALQSHLANCPECRQFNADSAHLTNTARQALKTGAPSHETLIAIKRKAKNVLTGLHPMPASVASGWTPALKLALAASIAAALGSTIWLVSVLMPATPGPVKVQIKNPPSIQLPTSDMQAELKDGSNPEPYRYERAAAISLAAIDESPLMHKILHDDLFAIEELRVTDQDAKINALDRELLILFGWAI